MVIDCQTAEGPSCETILVSTQLVTSSIPTTVETIFTTTKQITTTCQVTLGGTVTITPPTSPWLIDPSAKTTVLSPVTVPVTTVSSQTSLVPSTVSITSTIPIPVAAKTLIEIVLYLQGTNNDIYSTSTITLPSGTATSNTYDQPTPFSVVIGHEGDGGWSIWSDAQKGGLIAGCLVALLIILFLLLCACRRVRGGHVWVANDWSVNSQPAWNDNQYGYVHHRAGPLTIRGGNGADQIHMEQRSDVAHKDLPPTYQEAVSGKFQLGKDLLRRLYGERARFYRPPNQP